MANNNKKLNELNQKDQRSLDQNKGQKNQHFGQGQNQEHNLNNQNQEDNQDIYGLNQDDQDESL